MNNSSTIENDTISPQAMVPLSEGALVAYNAYLSTTIAFGVPGNLLVLLIYFKYGPVTSADWFIIFISIHDLISSLISVPIYLTFSTDAWIYYGNDVICKLHRFISQSVVLSSTFLICGLAIERFYKVCHPKSKHFTTAQSKHTCLVISVIATVFSLPCFVLFHNNQNNCGSVTQGLWVKVLMAYYTGMILSFLSAVVILIVTYSKIAVTILRSQINLLSHTKGESKNQPKRTHRFGVFLTICCQDNKIYPYDSRHLPRRELNAEKARPVEDASKDETSVYSNRIGGIRVTDDNENETETNGNGSEMNNVTVSRDSDHDTEADIFIGYQTFCRAKDEITPVGENLKLPNMRSKEQPRIKILKLKEREVSPNRSISETYQGGQSECHDHTINHSDHQTEQTRQSVPKCSLTSENNEILKTVKSMNKIRRIRRGLKTTRIVFLICLIFVLSWIPPWASFIYFIFASSSTQTSPTYLTVNMFFRMTYLINTFSNPILYTALNKRFRDKLKKFTCRT